MLTTEERITLTFSALRVLTYFFCPFWVLPFTQRLGLAQYHYFLLCVNILDECCLTKAHLMKIFTYENQQFFNIYFLCEHYISLMGDINVLISLLLLGNKL